MNSLLSYRDEGNGTPLVLVHGFCESKEVWKDFSAILSSKFRVITPDLPGFGESKLEDPNTSMDYYADKLHALLNHLNIHKCILVGHSLGGYIGLAFAEKYEHRLWGLGLFHSTAFEDTQEKKDNRDRTIKFVEKHGVEAFASTAVTPLFYPPKREELKKEIELMIRIAAGSSKEGVIAAAQAMRDRKDRTNVLKKIPRTSCSRQRRPGRHPGKKPTAMLPAPPQRGTLFGRRGSHGHVRTQKRYAEDSRRLWGVGGEGVRGTFIY